MKKIRLFAALLLVALCVGFSSCGGNSLEGTTWVAYDTFRRADGRNLTARHTLNFTTESSGSLWFRVDAAMISQGNVMTYTISNRNIVIKQYPNRTIKGRVGARRITLDMGGQRVVFRRE